MMGRWLMQELVTVILLCECEKKFKVISMRPDSFRTFLEYSRLERLQSKAPKVSKYFMWILCACGACSDCLIVIKCLSQMLWNNI